MRTNAIFTLVVFLTLAPQAMAQDLAFEKSRYSSPAQPLEIEVHLVLTTSAASIKSKKIDRKHSAVNIEIPYASISSMSYELATRHRVAEGAAVMALSLGAGAILMATKTKSHWLAIEHRLSSLNQTTVLRLDKTEYERVIAVLESKSGKKVAVLDSKAKSLNPTVQSKDMDELVPFAIERVRAALQPAMDAEGCNVTQASSSRIDCKRPRGYSERTGSGGESITATLEASNNGTRVRISTGKGVVGRLGKKNWSTAIYQEMIKRLQDNAVEPVSGAKAVGREPQG